MIKNKFYEAPEAELLVVRFEENILSAELGTIPDDEYDDQGIF